MTLIKQANVFSLVILWKGFLPCLKPGKWKQGCVNISHFLNKIWSKNAMTTKAYVLLRQNCYHKLLLTHPFDCPCTSYYIFFCPCNHTHILVIAPETPTLNITETRSGNGYRVYIIAAQILPKSYYQTLNISCSPTPLPQETTDPRNYSCSIDITGLHTRRVC